MSLASCQPQRSSNRIVVASAGKITSLDPAQASTFHALQLISALGEPLYSMNADGTLNPRLASDLPVIKDKGLTISIPLRKNILFHDGEPFNAKAMAFSLKRFMRIGTLNYILDGRIASIETPEEFLIRLKLTRPSSSLKGLLTSISLTPVSPKAYSNYQNRFLNKKFVGTGPYQLKYFQANQQRLDPYPLYWGKFPENEGINFINLSNSTSLFSALKTGEVDVLLSNSLEEDHKLSLKEMVMQNKLREGKGKALEIGYITLNASSQTLRNRVIREALLHSLDRNLISKRVSYGLRPPLKSLIPPGLMKKVADVWPTYNPKKARKLMKKAGFCSTRKLLLGFTFRSNVPADKLLALTWQAQIKRDLSDCLTLKLNGVESTTVYRQLGEGAYESVMLDWRGSYPDPEAYLTPLLSCMKIKKLICEKGEAASSGSFWSTPEINQSLAKSEKLSGKDRIEKLSQVEKHGRLGAAYLPVWFVTPKAWSQYHISQPEFDGSGKLLLNRLNRLY